MRYKAIAATTQKTSDMSELTNNALDDLVKTASGCLCLREFNPLEGVGVVQYARNENGKLAVIVSFFDDIMIQKEHRVVVGFRINKMTYPNKKQVEYRLIENAHCVSFGLTTNPVEKDLPEMVKLGE